MNKIAQHGSVVAIMTLTIGIGVSMAGPTIGGMEYVQTGECETVTAPFTPADAVVTAGSYSRLVELTVSGTGESLSTRLNDAFWLFTDVAHIPTAPVNNASYYQLNVSSNTLSGGNPGGQLAKSKIVYDLDADTEVSPVYVPAYRADHTYKIVVDLGTAVPSQVHFGVADGIFGDNSGEYTITICQLVVGTDSATGDGTRIRAKGPWFMYNEVDADVDLDEDVDDITFNIQAGNPKNGGKIIGTYTVTRNSAGNYTATYDFDNTIEIDGVPYDIVVTGEHLGISAAADFTAKPGRDDNTDFDVPFDQADDFFIFAHFSVEYR